MAFIKEIIFVLGYLTGILLLDYYAYEINTVSFFFGMVTMYILLRLVSITYEERGRRE